MIHINKEEERMKRSAGFTLIELLIVIALLGALAVGLLATIDPFEQLKKGRDTSIRNTVSEFYNANLRYYSTKGYFPWGQGETFNAMSLTDSAMTDASSGYVKKLIDAGELKNKFIDLAGVGNLAKVFVTSTSDESEAVCFKPESKSFQNDPNTIYDDEGGDGTDCKGAASGAATGDCYFCVQ